LKKTSQYRSKEEEIRDQHIYKNKAKNTEKKRKILASVYEEKDERYQKIVFFLFHKICPIDKCINNLLR
jgi:hypothetical protein